MGTTLNIPYPPNASPTVVGVSRFANATEALQSSQTIALNPDDAREIEAARIRGGTGFNSGGTAQFRSWVSSGTVTLAQFNSPLIRVQSSATPNGYAGCMTGSIFSTTDFSTLFTRALECVFYVSSVATATNGFFRIGYGQTSGKTGNVSDPVGNGFWAECRGLNNRIWLRAHNGTAMSNLDTGVDLGIALSVFQSFRIRKAVDGSVTLTYNGAVIGTLPANASGTSGSPGGSVAIETSNGGSSANHGCDSTMPQLVILT